MHVEQKDSVEYDAQSLSGGHEFDSGSYIIVKVEKVIKSRLVASRVK